jgi:hypothetical protein
MNIGKKISWEEEQRRHEEAVKKGKQKVKKAVDEALDREAEDEEEERCGDE